MYVIVIYMLTKSEMILNLYLSKYDPKYCQQLIEHMSKGKSFDSFAGKIRVTLATIKAWKEKHEEFAEAFEIGDAQSLLFWEEDLHAKATGIENGEHKGQGHWEAKQFKMTNAHPEHFKVKNDGKQIGNLTFVIESGVPRNESEKTKTIEIKPGEIKIIQPESDKV